MWLQLVHFAKSRYFFFISQNPDFINVVKNVDVAKSRSLFCRIQIFFFISQNPYFAISQNPVSQATRCFCMIRWPTVALLLLLLLLLLLTLIWLAAIPPPSQGVLPNKEVGGGGLDLTSSLEANLGQGPAMFTK